MRPLDVLRFFEELLLRDLLRLREPPRLPDLLRLRDPERLPEQLRFFDAERLLLPPFDFDRAFEQDFERDRDRFFMAAFFMAAFLFGQEGLLGLLQFLLWFCSSSSLAVSLDRDLLPGIVGGKLFHL